MSLRPKRAGLESRCSLLEIVTPAESYRGRTGKARGEQNQSIGRTHLGRLRLEGESSEGRMRRDEDVSDLTGEQIANVAATLLDAADQRDVIMVQHE